MEQDNNQDKVELDKDSEMNPIQQQHTADEPAVESRSSIDGSQTNNYSQNQIQWMNRQVSNLERELLLNNNCTAKYGFISNWTKVILSALAVLIPGIGQIVGVIIGLVFVSDDINPDKRSFGAALLTVSVVAFILLACFWFIFALTFGPQLFYY